MSSSSKKSKNQANAIPVDGEKYRAIVENAMEGVLVMQGGKRVYYNPRWLEITGYSAEGYKEVPFFSLVHPADRERAEENYQKIIKDEAFESFMQLRFITRSGAIKHLEMDFM